MFTYEILRLFASGHLSIVVRVGGNAPEESAHVVDRHLLATGLGEPPSGSGR